MVPRLHTTSQKLSSDNENLLNRKKQNKLTASFLENIQGSSPHQRHWILDRHSTEEEKGKSWLDLHKKIGSKLCSSIIFTQPINSAQNNIDPSDINVLIDESQVIWRGGDSIPQKDSSTNDYDESQVIWRGSDSIPQKDSSTNDDFT